ncbi:MAG: DUF542 domain-containing protein [Chitinophagales bacterium]
MLDSIQKIDSNALVNEIVANNYRTAAVFRKYGIDFCCGGKQPLNKACALFGLSEDMLLKELEFVSQTISISNQLNFEEWDLSFLMDYIIHIHHDYIKKALPLLIESLTHFAEGHRKKFAYLDELISLVSDLNREMLPHNAREEESVFPYIRKIKHAHENKEPYAGLLVRTLSKPMRDMMKHDHNMVVEFLTRIREITNNYALPPQACTNHKVNFQLLKEMDDDLMQHLRLETQILFPKAIQMERELLQSS